MGQGDSVAAVFLCANLEQALGSHASGRHVARHQARMKGLQTCIYAAHQAAEADTEKWARER